MPKKYFLPALIVIGVLGAATVAATPIQPDRRDQAAVLTPFDIALTKAYEALAANKLTDARRFFQEAGQIDPNAILPWLGLADVARMSNDSPGVESAVKKAAELAPDRAEPVIAMARWRYANKAYDEAEALFRKAAKMDPKSPTPLVDLGDLHASVRRDPDTAMSFYRQAIQVDPQHAGANYALGTLLLARDTLGAIPYLETAQKLSGNKNPLPSLALGRANSQLRKWKDAEEAFTRALTIQPNLMQAYIGRATTFIESGDRTKALADLRKAEELNPKDPEPSFRLGMLHEAQGAVKEAYLAYERAIRLEPKFVLAYNNLAWLAATRGERLDDALAWIQKARSLAPKEAILLDTHGWVLRARGDLDGAMGALTECVALRPTAPFHYHLGVVQMEKGRTEDARNSFRKALQIQPDFADAMDTRARLKQLNTPPTSTK